jgi:hypothetical protein
MPRAIQVRSVVGFPDYQVRSDGTIYSVKFGKKIRLRESVVQGYSQVCLYRKGEKCLRKVHRIVLEAFFGPNPEGSECCHKNGIRTDNRLANLRWDSRKENMRDQYTHNTRIRGVSHPLRKLTLEEVLDIRKRYSSKSASQTQLSREYGVIQAHISRIIRRKAWAHI